VFNKLIIHKDMADFNSNPLEYLKESLETRALLKQKVWHTTQQFFVKLKDEANKLVDELKGTIPGEDVPIEVTEVGDTEFSIKFGSDVLVFGMHTNIVTFDEKNYLMKLKDVIENKDLSYFGQIMIYDFMADSVKYERTGDAGFLISRLLINVDGKFHIEGVRGLRHLFTPEGTESSSENISLFLKKSMAVTIESDLMGQEFSQIQQITLGEKLARNKEIGYDSKIGFQMSLENKIDG